MNGVTFRLDAPSALGLANSLHEPGAHYRRRAGPDEPAHDHLASPDAAVEFLVTHEIPDPGVVPTEAQLDRLRSLRLTIRALADEPSLDLGAWRSSLDADLGGVDFRLTPDGVVRSSAAGWDGITDDLLPATLALVDDRERLRRCGNPRCRWLFVDRSRRGSRIWCEAAVCGNRMRVGRHRMRPAGRADDAPAAEPGYVPR
jgi:CGNR zinc finger/Putative stress-induced transcription regulator